MRNGSEKKKPDSGESGFFFHCFASGELKAQRVLHIDTPASEPWINRVSGLLNKVLDLLRLTFALLGNQQCCEAGNVWRRLARSDIAVEKETREARRQEELAVNFVSIALDYQRELGAV